jgi:sugar transferase (PEP-CTERM/EpsH1 system associated)
MARGDLLMLVHRIPYPPNKGDKIRSYNLLRYLASKGWRIHLCALADKAADLVHQKALQAYCASVRIEPLNPRLQKAKSLAAVLQGRPLSAGYYYRKSLQRVVDEILNTQDVKAVFCYCSPMAEYLFRSDVDVFGSLPRPRLIMDLVDIDSDKWRQYARRTRSPMKWVYFLESRLLKTYEEQVVRRFDSTVLVSEMEAAMLRQRTGHPEKIFGVSNGVDLDYFSRTTVPPAASDRRMVFCGAMDYLPNIDAVCWFAREVLPLVRGLAGEVEFDIVGAEPAEEVRALAGLPGVRVTGRVEDVRPYVREAALSVAPIRIARGLQNKVLEAMAMGKPVLCTPEAFEGINAVPDRDILIASAEPKAFAEAAAALLEDANRRKEIGESARRVVEEGYCWESCLAGLDHLFASVNDSLAPGKAKH